MSDENIVLDLPDEVILRLALEAHKKDIKLNDHLLNIIKDYIKEATGDVEEAKNNDKGDVD